jgi:hypothetical protein
MIPDATTSLAKGYLQVSSAKSRFLEKSRRPARLKEHKTDPCLTSTTRLNLPTDRLLCAQKGVPTKMAISPRETEQKIERMWNAWQTLAPGKSFGGMTVAQFEAAAATALSAREAIADLEDQLTQAELLEKPRGI